MHPKKNLFGLSPSELVTVLADEGEKPFRARQLQAWMYRKRCFDFAAMTDFSKSLRERLEAGYVIEAPIYSAKHQSTDGSIKYIFDVGKGQQVEAVYMPMTKGVTMCLSSQVGCAQDCSFCLTAQMGFIRNLSAGEIVGQAYIIAKEQELDGPFNVVMMGMGEPLLNLTNLLKSLELFTSELGFDLSPKRITVSTSGHVRNLKLLGEFPKLPRIAVSLNATTDEVRTALMPINLRWNIRELLEACRELPIPPREKLTIEYVLLRDINDSTQDARRLVRLLANIRCKVNLIPFNETEGLEYRQPDLKVIENFRAVLDKGRILNLVRWSKGRDIGAACGQLATPVVQRGAHVRQAPEP